MAFWWCRDLEKIHPVAVLLLQQSYFRKGICQPCKSWSLENTWDYLDSGNRRPDLKFITSPISDMFLLFYSFYQDISWTRTTLILFHLTMVINHGLSFVETHHRHENTIQHSRGVFGLFVDNKTYSWTERDSNTTYCV